MEIHYKFEQKQKVIKFPQFLFRKNRNMFRHTVPSSDGININVVKFDLNILVGTRWNERFYGMGFTLILIIIPNRRVIFMLMLQIGVNS